MSNTYSRYPCTQVISRVHPASAWPYTFHETGLCVKPLLLQGRAPVPIRCDCFFVSIPIGQIRHRLQGQAFPSNGESGPCIGILLVIREETREIDAPWAIVARQGQVLYEGDCASSISLAWLPFVAEFATSSVVCCVHPFPYCPLLSLHKSTTTPHCLYTQEHCTKSFTLYMTAGQFSLNNRCDPNPSRWRLQ